MAATLKVIVAGFATFVEEFLEEESVQEEGDVLEEFLPLFYANNLLSERRKAVCIEGYAETVVPNYNLSEFRSHFRISKYFDHSRHSPLALSPQSLPRLVSSCN